MLAEEIEIVDGDGTIAEVVARGRGINFGVLEVEEILVRLALGRPLDESYTKGLHAGSS